MKLINSGLVLILALVLGSGFLACRNFRAYNNTFYLAQKAFNSAEENRLRAKGSRPSPPVLKLYDDAVIQASRILTFYSKSKYVDDALLLIGKSYYYQEEYPKAERKFQELLSGFPKSNLTNEANFFLGSCHFKMNNAGNAVAAWDKVLSAKKNKFQKEVLFMTAELKFKEKDYDGAIALYQKYLSQGKGDLQAPKAQTKIAESFWEKGDYQSSWKAYAEVKNYTQDKELTYQSEFKTGKTAYQLEKYTEGMAIFKKLEANKDYYTHVGEVKLELALGHLALGQVEEAQKLNEEVITAFPKTLYSSRAYYQQGIILQDYRQDLMMAQDMFAKAKEEFPLGEYAKLALQRSADIAKLQEYKKELSAGESEKLVETQFLLAEFYLSRMSKPDSALAAYKGIVAKYPQSDFAPKSLLALAYICGSLLQDSVGCSSACQDLIANYPESDYALEARKILNQDVSGVDSISASFLFNRAEDELFVWNRPDSALTLYEKIVAQYPNSAYTARALLGKAYVLEQTYPVAEDTVLSDSTAYLAYLEVAKRYPDTEAGHLALKKLGQKAYVPPPKPKETLQTTTPPADSMAALFTQSAEGDTADTLVLGLPRAPDPISIGNFTYPQELVEARIQGFVYVKLEIDYFSGETKKAEIMKGVGNAEIDRRVLDAMKVAKFDTKRLDPSQIFGAYGYRFRVQPPLSSNQ